VGIPSSPRGVPQIEVKFDIDANGIVNVSAKDKATGKEQNVQIQASGGLSDSDIDQMVKDAEDNADSDKEKRELVDLQNQAEASIHTTEKSIKDLGDECPAEPKAAAEAAISTLKESLETSDKASIQEKLQALQESSMKIGEAAYRKAQEESAGAESEPMGEDATPSDVPDDVVDADFTDLSLDDDDAESNDSKDDGKAA
ncbi:MAG: Hsp70 family protein, partial [Alphaproteobacteria bacterium]|nr:Hsp70 family protein [Alphaproteobacteria bacterium]